MILKFIGFIFIAIIILLNMIFPLLITFEEMIGLCFLGIAYILLVWVEGGKE